MFGHLMCIIDASAGRSDCGASEASEGKIGRDMIHEDRIAALNDQPIRRGRYVLYWMQASQREHYNHALERAVERANELSLPTLVCFGLDDTYPEANARHFAFLLQGLAETAKALAERGIGFVAHKGSPPEVALALAPGAAMVVCDRGYLRHQRQWRDRLADEAPCAVEQIEADVVVPVESVTDKAEYAARTIRPKLHRLMNAHLQPLRRRPVKHPWQGTLDGLDLSDPHRVLAGLDVDRSVKPSERFIGGTSEGERVLAEFIAGRLGRYADQRSDPSLGIESHVSPYLHFGQLSPVWIALQIKQAGPGPSVEGYLEELIVRRELAINYVQFVPRYDRYEALPDWARRTLARHADDERPYLYDQAALEACDTHDVYFNAAMAEMVETGKMHNYMRMYWGKRILEWAAAPAEAFKRTLHLNNKYFLDGRDPNSYANVGWVFGLHDRPWKERPIFGQTRYMNAAGLERKFDIDAYVRQWGG